MIAIFSVFAWSTISKSGTEKTITIKLDENNALIKSNGFSFKPLEVITKQGIESTDLKYSFEVFGKLFKMGDLTITVRNLENGDQFIFNKFENTSNKSKTLPLQIQFNKVNSYEFYDFNQDEPIREHDKVYGIDYTTNVKGLYKLKENEITKYNLYLSQNYISKELTKTYNETDKSTLREFISEDQSLHISQPSNSVNEPANMNFELTLKTTGENQISESWFLLSQEELFPDEKVLEEYKNETNHNYLHNPKWNTADGNYTKLPWSIEPGTKLGYGRNLVALQDKTSLKYYSDTKERFFFDMVINSINHLENFRGKSDKLWETEYTSNWLKNNYGIQAPYTDTRHNENIALFLTNAGKELGLKEIENSYILYADFLSNQQKLGNMIETENGFYITDYFSKNQTKKTHASLNHTLGEMNFLLETYKESQNEKYLNTALHIKKAVEDSGTDWINQKNGDLWYQINGDHTFEGEDYPTLTLEDLTKSLTLFNELNISYSSVLEELIESKTIYIIKNNIPIKKSTVEKLRHLELGEQLSNYDNTTKF